MNDEPTDVERNEAMLASELDRQQKILDTEWRKARDAELLAAFAEYVEDHPIVMHVLPEGREHYGDRIGTPAGFARYLEKYTGVDGWLVELVGSKFMVTPPIQPMPQRLAKFGITLRKVGE